MKRINSALLYNLFMKFCKSGEASWAEVRRYVRCQARKVSHFSRAKNPRLLSFLLKFINFNKTRFLRCRYDLVALSIVSFVCKLFSWRTR